MAPQDHRHKHYHKYALHFLNLLFLVAQAKRTDHNALLYTPPDNYLIDCGSSQDTKLDDGRTFKSDSSSSHYIQTDNDIIASVDSIPAINASSSFSLQLYRTARVFTSDSKYSFYVSSQGLHWLRLYFFTLSHPDYNLTSAVFSVSMDNFVLLHDFSLSTSISVVYKEYLFNVTDGKFDVMFKPKKRSLAFINAIEFVSAPNSLVADSASMAPQGNTFSELGRYGLEICYRLNVGGPIVTPINDILARTWLPDVGYNMFPSGASNVSVSPSSIKNRQGLKSMLHAPN